MEKFKAGMVLGAVGDALGYRKGRWEGCISGKKIQEELASLGGLGAQKLDPDNWPLSDATLMHITTAEALVTGTFRIDHCQRGRLESGNHSKSRHSLPSVFCQTSHKIFHFVSVQ